MASWCSNVMKELRACLAFHVWPVAQQSTQGYYTATVNLSMGADHKIEGNDLLKTWGIVDPLVGFELQIVA